VLRTGRRALVYLLDAPGRYRPVEVELGPEIGEQIVIRRGIVAGQQVVASGQFLIDSEATLQGLTARATAPAATAPAPATAAATAAASAAATAAVAEHEVRGTVRAIKGNIITLAHEAVPALQWPAMTMPFQLARPELASGFKAGDTVQFRFRQQGDDNVVTAIARSAATGGAKP